MYQTLPNVYNSTSLQESVLMSSYLTKYLKTHEVRHSNGNNKYFT